MINNINNVDTNKFTKEFKQIYEKYNKYKNSLREKKKDMFEKVLDVVYREKKAPNTVDAGDDEADYGEIIVNDIKYKRAVHPLKYADEKCQDDDVNYSNISLEFIIVKYKKIKIFKEKCKPRKINEYKQSLTQSYSF
jgi:hypothetical protein